jgi:hypothetical protein
VTIMLVGNTMSLAFPFTHMSVFFCHGHDFSFLVKVIRATRPYGLAVRT